MDESSKLAHVSLYNYWCKQIFKPDASRHLNRVKHINSLRPFGDTNIPVVFALSCTKKSQHIVLSP